MSVVCLIIADATYYGNLWRTMLRGTAALPTFFAAPGFLCPEGIGVRSTFYGADGPTPPYNEGREAYLGE